MDFSELKEVDEEKKRRRNLLSFLSPDDVLMFENGKGREYFFVESIGPKKVYATGMYVSSSGEQDKKRISLDKIAERNPKVAYLRNILQQ